LQIVRRLIIEGLRLGFPQASQPLLLFIFSFLAGGGKTANDSVDGFQAFTRLAL